MSRIGSTLSLKNRCGQALPKKHEQFIAEDDMKTICKKNSIRSVLQLLWIGALICLCLWVMGLNPIWNGEMAYHRNQYEKMAVSLSHLRPYFEYDVDERLLTMENPYDAEARDKLGVNVHWDHAYYKGRYYMYFGVVPVCMFFLPYLLLTGRSLTTYHATQIYTAFIIIGIFVFFRFLRNRFFPKMNDFILTALGTAVSLASVWYFCEAPALYCTAVSSAVCMMLWSIFFYFYAVFAPVSFNKRIFFGFCGAGCGALCFGCRPPVALANIIAVPLFIVFLKTNRIRKNQVWKVVMMAVPYVIVAALLMTYNYKRFDDPLEFGQSYQMTFYDQHNIGFLTNFTLGNIISGFKAMFFEARGIDSLFPYVRFGGIFAEFPMFLIGIFGLLIPSVRRYLRDNQLWPTALTILLTPFLITFSEVIMSPIILERYHSDLYFLEGILTFLVIGCIYETAKTSHGKLNAAVVILCLITAVTAILLFFVPNDYNYTEFFRDFFDRLQAVMPVLKLR